MYFNNCTLNKKGILQITFICFLLLFTSCQFIALKVYNVKKPDYVSEKRIRKAIDKYELNYFEHYALDEKGFIYLYQNHAWRNDVIIYYPNGKSKSLINDVQTCDAEVMDFLPNYTIYGDTLSTQFIALDSIVGEIRNLDGSPSNLDFSTYDYVIMIQWASFWGRVNRDDAMLWANELNKDTVQFSP